METKQGGVRVRDSVGANFDWLVREVSEVATFKLISEFSKEVTHVRVGTMFQGAETASTKAPGRKAPGVFKTRESKPVFLENSKVFNR